MKRNLLGPVVCGPLRRVINVENSDTSGRVGPLLARVTLDCKHSFETLRRHHYSPRMRCPTCLAEREAEKEAAKINLNEPLELDLESIINTDLPSPLPPPPPPPPVAAPPPLPQRSNAMVALAAAKFAENNNGRIVRVTLELWGEPFELSANDLFL